MGILKKFIGPTSKYDETIPYTYIAKVRIIDRHDKFVNHCFADTICGLIEYLSNNNILPEDVELFACYQKKEIPIDKEYCLSEKGKWLENRKSVILSNSIIKKLWKNNIKDTLNLVNVRTKIVIVKEADRMYDVDRYTDAIDEGSIGRTQVHDGLFFSRQAYDHMQARYTVIECVELPQVHIGGDGLPIAGTTYGEFRLVWNRDQLSIFDNMDHDPRPEGGGQIGLNGRCTRQVILNLFFRQCGRIG